MKKIYSILVFFVLFMSSMVAQRYINPTFTEVEKKADVVYGTNANMLTISNPAIAQATPRVLRLDVYSPKGDNATNRPLAVIVPAGNFLPHPANNVVSQNKRNDLPDLYMAEKLAKMGYVVAIIDLRLGWNPQAATQELRAEGAVQAAIRQCQDLRTAIRFFRKSVAESNNPYGIDPEKITAIGSASGFASVGFAAYTTDYAKDFLTNKNYIITGANGQPRPMWIEAVHGDLYGLKVGVNPTNNDTLSYPNHVGYSSNFKAVVQLGAALSDTVSLSKGDPVLISAKGTTGGSTPWNYGVSSLPNIGPVIEQFGVGLIHERINNVGMNDVLRKGNYTDAFSARQKDLAKKNPTYFPKPYPELYPLTDGWGTPWVFWDSLTNANNKNGKVFSPNNHDYSKKVLDSIFSFAAPRLCLAMNLGCDLKGIYVGTNDVIQASEVGLVMSPNPATEYVNFQSKNETPIQSIYVYDLNGRLVKAHVDINSSQFTMQRHSLPTGLYLAQVRFEKGFVTQRVVIE